MPRLRIVLPASVAVLAAMLLGGCSAPPASDHVESIPSASDSASATTPTLTFFSVTVTGPWGERPMTQIGDEVQEGSSFIVQDVVAGTGAVAKDASRVTVQYVGRGAKSKRTFDSSWDRGQAFTFVPKDVAFAAFNRGVPGMRVGGRRLVIVPASMGFGDTPPRGSGLTSGEALIFVVDLVSVA